MRMSGFICQDDYLAKCAKLSDQEVGRLFRALMEYHATGIAPELTGRESIAFDFIKEDIDKADSAYAVKCEKNKMNRTNVDVRQRTITNDDERPQNRIEIELKENDIKEPPKGGKKSAGRFTPPTIEDVEAYCRERNNGVNAQRWFDFYSAKGWKIGNQTMKDWKAAVRTWEQRDDNRKPVKQVQAARYSQRQYTEKELEQLADDPVISILEGMA